MSLNKVMLQGRVPFDHEIKNGDDDKKAYLGFSFSVARNYKPEGEKYYPEDLLYCKAYAGKAKFIDKNFPKGSSCIIEGEIRREDDYEKDGKPVKGTMYVHVNEVYFINGGTKAAGGDVADTSTKAAPKKTEEKKTPGNNPLAAKKKMPF